MKREYAVCAAPSRTAAAAGGDIIHILEQQRQAQAQQLEGSWAMVLTPTVPPPGLTGKDSF